MKYVLMGLAAILIVFILIGAVYAFMSHKGNGGASSYSGVNALFITSHDGGLSWQAAGAGKLGTALPNISVQTMSYGHLDNGASVYYVGTRANGVWRSTDAADHWEHITGKGLPSNFFVSAIGLDVQNPNNFFIAGTYAGLSRVYRTKTFGHTFREVYTAGNRNVGVFSAVVDPSNSRFVYLGTSDSGLLIASDDFGTSWKPLHSFRQAVRNVVVSPHNSNQLFVLTRQGVWRSGDQGSTWEQVFPAKGQYSSGEPLRLVDTQEDDSVYLISTNALWRTNDAGKTWQNIDLTTNVKNTAVSDITIDAKNPSHLIVALSKTILMSTDSGSHWSSHTFSITRAISRLTFDPIDPNVIVITTSAPPSQGLFNF